MTRQTHQTRLRPVSETSKTDVSDTLEPDQDTDQDKNPDCDCDDLPDGFPCANCFTNGDADFTGEFA